MLILDCLFLPCPQPIVRCKESLEAFSPEKIEVLVDNKAAVENVTRFLEKNNYQVTVIEKEKNIWSLSGVNSCLADNMAQNNDMQDSVIPKDDMQDSVIPKDDMQDSYEDYALALAHSEYEKKTIVFLTSDYLGHGDDMLGEKLMTSFLSCLKEMHLWQIILLNGGVRLTTKAGKNLESLQELEANGVRILVCGACLSHYGLYEEKQVGDTTNMLDIVTALDVADKVIRP